MKDLKDYSDEELESAWQESATKIGTYAKLSWHTKTKEEEEKFRTLATMAQDRQSKIQKEISRRGV